MSYETWEPGTDTQTHLAAKRMKMMIATPDEIAEYRYNPNGARENKHPAIPCEDYMED
jgi:hypothetical protein